MKCFCGEKIITNGNMLCDDCLVDEPPLTVGKYLITKGLTLNEMERHTKQSTMTLRNWYNNKSKRKVFDILVLWLCKDIKIKCKDCDGLGVKIIPSTGESIGECESCEGSGEVS